MEIDYEKEYKAMVQRARELHETGNELTRRQMEIVCPGLRESEDERHRKWILEYLYDGLQKSDEQFKDQFKSAISWLEKQKDASEAIEAVERIDSYITEHTANSWEMDDSNPDKKYYCGVDDTLSEIAGILQGVYAKQKESLHIPETCKENADSFTGGIIEVRSFQRGIEEGRRREKQKEQTSDIILKAFENSKTDYSLEEREEAIDYSEKVLPTSIAFGESDEEFLLHKVIEAAYIAGQKEQKPPIAGNDFGWIDELKHDLKHPEELDEKVQEVLKKRPKPAEWSEEDKKMMKCCRIAINHYEKTCNIGDHLPTKFNIDGDLVGVDKVNFWLKSLRPSWKPSKEQMSALNYFIKLWGNSDDQLEYTKIFNTVKSLRNDLEKLM